MNEDHNYSCRCTECREFWGDDPQGELKTLRHKVKCYEQALKDIQKLPVGNTDSSLTAHHAATFVLIANCALGDDHT